MTQTKQPTARARICFVLTLSAAALAYLPLYTIINRYSSNRTGGTLYLRGEARLPLVPEAAVVYALGFLLPVILVWFLPDDRRLRQALAAFAGTVIAAFSIYLLFPVCIERPAATGRDAEWLRLARLDDPCNCFPSLHVAICWLVYLACRDVVRRPRVLLVSVVGISASTILVKQHYVVDVAAGAILAALAWQISKTWSARRKQLQSTPRGVVS